MKTANLYLGTILFLLPFGASASVYYVKAGAPGGNGTSWSKAFNNLNSALGAAAADGKLDQIWVAKGTYKPSLPAGSGNLVTFRLPSNVAIYGGFAGTETSLSSRNRDANPTILSGDILGNDTEVANSNSYVSNPTKSDNAWHVLTADGVTGVTLDSLIVKDGYAAGTDDGTFDQTLPGPPQFVIATLTVADDTGGGMLVRGNSLVTLNNMRFEYNGADAAHAVLGGNPLLGVPPVASGGGAVAAIDEGTLVTITNSSFRYNNAFSVGGNGGALHALVEASFTIVGSSFENNTAFRNGGAIHAKDAGTISITASSLKNNVVVGAQLIDESGGGIGTIDTNLSVAASYFEGNKAGILAGAGGAIFFHTPLDDQDVYTFTVNNSVFYNNQAFALGGGAINVLGVHPQPGSTAQITNSIFTGNVGGLGGAVHISSIPATVDNCLFVGNQAWVQGGAFYSSNMFDVIVGNVDPGLGLPGPETTISDSTFYQNAIIGIPTGANTPAFTPTSGVDLVAVAFGPFFGGPTGSRVLAIHPGGGAIGAGFSAHLTVSDCSFIKNSANNSPDDDGSAVLVGGTEGHIGATGQGINEAYLSIDDCSLYGNTSSGGHNIWKEDFGTPQGGVVLIQDGSCQ